MQKQSERIVSGSEDWHRQNQMKKLRIIMTVVAVFLCISIAAGAVLAWFQIRKSTVPDHAGTQISSATSSLGGAAAAAEPDNLILVNASNKLPAGYKAELTEYGGFQVNRSAAPDLERMMKAAEQSGAPLKLTAGYVDEASQEKAYQAEVERLMSTQKVSRVLAESRAQASVGRGGYSENQTGLAVAFSAEGLKSGADFSQTAQYRWLVQNCVNYGFILRYPMENSSPKTVNSKTGCYFDPTHFRYVGEGSAVKMREFSMCFEEYSSYLSQQRAGT